MRAPMAGGGAPPPAAARRPRRCAWALGTSTASASSAAPHIENIRDKRFLLVEVTQVIGAQAPERKGVLHCCAVSLLELQGVTKRYPGVTALDGVDFDVAAGTVHAVVGENGAGKSTLLRLI